MPSDREHKGEGLSQSHLSLNECLENPEFGRSFESVILKQLVRRLQANYRKKHQKVYEKDERGALCDSSSTSIHFIPKPAGPEAEAKLDHFAACVNEGRLQDLPYEDAEFHVYLNEALRLGKIKKRDQIIAPQLIWSDLIEYRNRPKKYSAIRKFQPGEPNEPYPITEIGSAIDSDRELFQQELKSIPSSERCYYTVNFSHKQEITFLCQSLQMGVKKHRLQPLLQKYIERFQLTLEEKARFMSFLAKQEGKFSAEECGWYGAFFARHEFEETLRYCFLWDDENDKWSISSLCPSLCPPLWSNKYTQYYHNNPLLISFLFEMREQEPRVFQACLNELGLSHEAITQFNLFLHRKEINHAAALLIPAFKNKMTPESKKYQKMAGQAHYAKAAHLLWQETSGGKQMALCALLNDEHGERLNPDQRKELKDKLYEFIEKLQGTQKVQAIKLIERLESKNKARARSAALVLRNFIQSEMSPLTQRYWEWSLLCYLDYSSLLTIINANFLGTSAPWIAISPDYDSHDRTTPLLCSVTYTQGAFDALLHTLYGKRAVGAEFGYGGFGLYHYRRLGENLSVLGRFKPHKPTELFYPGLLHNQDVHGVQPHVAQLTRHDLLAHNKVLSDEPYFDLLNYFKRFHREKGYGMSQTLYLLVDKAISMGDYHYRCKKTGEDAKLEACRVAWMEVYMPLAGRTLKKGERDKEFWKHIEAYDENLALLIDMHINENRWMKLFDDKLPSIYIPDVRGILQKISNLVTQHGMKEQRIFYLLAYRLQVDSDDGLLKQLKQVNLKHILQWERNAGLRFYRDYGFGDNCRVEELKPGDLCGKLREVVSCMHLSPSLHFSPFQGSIYSILAYRLREHPNAALWRTLLSSIDLTKILRFRSTDQRLYFVDPRSNNRELNLLTTEKLPAGDEALAARLARACREAYQAHPKIFQGAELNQEVCQLLELQLESKEEEPPEFSSLLASVLKDDLAGLKEKLKQLGQERPLPPVILETAFERASEDLIIEILLSNWTSSYNALKILADRQQSNRRITSLRVFDKDNSQHFPSISYILCLFLQRFWKPREQEALSIENLFHPEILVSQDDFLSQLTTYSLAYSYTQSLLKSEAHQNSAFVWWVHIIFRNQFWHKDGESLLKFVKHPIFELPEFKNKAIEALKQRQGANIALSAKLKRDDLYGIVQSLEPEALKSFELEEEKASELKPEPDESKPASKPEPEPGAILPHLSSRASAGGVAIQADGQVFPFRKWLGCIAAGVVLAAILLALAGTGYLAPLAVWLGLQGTAMASSAAMATLGLCGFFLPMTCWQAGKWLKKCFSKPQSEKLPWTRTSLKGSTYTASQAFSSMPASSVLADIPSQTQAYPAIKVALRPFMNFPPPQTSPQPPQRRETPSLLSADRASLAKCNLVRR